MTIDPEIFASIQNFDLAVKTFANGDYLGSKRSKRLGAGMEFSQYRPYSQGDDLRQLDWKMYARTDKYFVKQSEIESNVEVTFIIDDSQSMSYIEDEVSKLQICKLIAAVIGFLAIESGDAVALASSEHLITGNDKRHWVRLLNVLYEMNVNEDFELPLMKNRKRREILIVFSDLYDDSLLAFIQSLKSRTNEVIVFHILGENERNFNFKSTVKMKDLETGEIIELDAKSYKHIYKVRMNQWLENLKKGFLTRGIDYQLIDFTVPIETIVNIFVQHRKTIR